MSNRLAGRYGYPKDDPFRVTFHPDRLQKPGRWKKPRQIFVCSMGDLFHDDVKFNDQYKIFEMMGIYNQHTYIVLTKRAANMRAVMPDIWFHLGRNYPDIEFPLKNVIGMVTAENQAMADKRVPDLLNTPFTVRGISVEPMLGPVDPWMPEKRKGWVTNVPGKGIDWVICGGESGPGARPMHPEWARSLRDQCHGANIPFFFKQWGEFISAKGFQVIRVGKKKAGRLLDGRTWDEYPAIK